MSVTSVLQTLRQEDPETGKTHEGDCCAPWMDVETSSVNILLGSWGSEAATISEFGFLYF